MKPLSRGPWIPAISALALSLLLCSPLPAAPLPLSFAGVWTVALDNRYYRVDPGLLSVDAGHFTLAAATSLVNCRRGDGSTQTTTGNALVYAGGVRIVYLDGAATAFALDGGASGPVLTLASATGDIVCDGAVASPGMLFSGGFE